MSHDSPHTTLIKTFYQAFQNKDYKTMQSCYHDEARFSDEVFQDLNAEEVRAMWEMLIQRGKDLRIEFSDVEANEHSGSASWRAHYSFSAKKRPVVNSIKASFEFKDGKIYRHKDKFSFRKWAAQALGISGKLFGRTKWLRSKVSQQAISRLKSFQKQSQ